MAENMIDIPGASQDLQTIEDFVNLPADSEVYPRLLPSVNVGTLAGARQAIFEAGGLPATPFATKALMTASALVDGDYAQVTDDTVNNGLYVKTAGAWVKSDYDPFGASVSYVDNNALFKPELIDSPTDLNTLKTSGYFITSANSYATIENNYPFVAATGVLSVFANSKTSLIIQRYFTLNGVSMFRMYAGDSWSAWYSDLTTEKLKPLLTDYQLKADALALKGFLGASDNLDSFDSAGLWVQSSGTPATTENNYPEKSSGYLLVVAAIGSSIILQTYTTSDGNIYNRSRRGGSWRAWTLVGTSEQYFVRDKLGTQDANDLKTLAIYIKNSQSADDVSSLNYPTKNAGVLKVYKGTATSFIIQEFMSVADGAVYLRSFNNVVWSEWVTNGSGGSPVVDADAGFFFDKKENALTFYTPSVSGSNSIKTVLERRVSLPKQQDAWGITVCEEVSSSLSTVKPIVTDGVWEVAIRAAENAGDHSGGAHGDEVLQSAYFLVDGMYYAQDAVISGRAKEIKFYQKSTLFIENTTNVLCYKDMVWIFDGKDCRLKHSLTFPTARTLNTAWVAMLPVLRKVNQDNTGAQVTDTEVRSFDGIPVDVSEPTFPIKANKIADGSSISLSSKVSGIAAELVINSLKVSSSNHLFVQNNTAFNKIYVSGMPASGTYTTSVNEVWDTDVTFKITTRN